MDPLYGEEGATVNTQLQNLPVFPIYLINHQLPARDTISLASSSVASFSLVQLPFS